MKLNDFLAEIKYFSFVLGFLPILSFFFINLNDPIFFRFVPQSLIFNVKIYEKGINIENVVNKSKAVGEPPLMLALSVFMALKDAIKNENKKSKNLKAPATAENILLNIN